MSVDSDVQNDFIAKLIHDENHVAVFLKSGIKLDGVLVGVDLNAVWLEKGGVIQLVYKNAISTICYYL